MVSSLQRFGLRNVVVTGGEPLLVDELPRLLQSLHNIGVSTVLSTNGLLLEDRLSSVAPYLNWIALPLDADMATVNQNMRRGDDRAFYTTLELIPKIRAQFPHVKIKLGTVVCRINENHVGGIPQLCKGASKPDIWKLYQVSYSSYGKDNRSILELTDDDFETVASLAEHEAAKISLPVVFYRRRDRSGKYLFFEPNGDVMAIVEGREMVIGNFLEDLNDLPQEWLDFVDPRRVWANVMRTYPGVENG
jgi:MoaA/NifB/PqqE/SkfB family radical SAM enzyme